MYDTVDTMRLGQLANNESSDPSKILLERHQRIRVAFVTNFCPHYRIKTFETLARYQDLDFFFCSNGQEWYWQQENGVQVGDFRYEYLPGIQVTRRLRLVPWLVTRLWQNNYDVYIKCINGRFALPVTYLVAKLRRKPFILWTGIWMSLRTPFHRLAFPLTRWIYRHADSVVVYGEHVKQYLVEQDVKQDKIFVAAHAVDNEAYNTPVSETRKAALRTDLSVKNRKVVLYLGRLEKEKGLDYLIKAFTLLKRDDAVLVIAGDGSLREELKTLATCQGIQEYVRFIGYVSPQDALLYYAIATVYVLPSVSMPTGKEPWGLVVNEAMNQGLPVIATEAVGAAAGGLVQSEVNGLIVPERDSRALGAVMARLLNDDALREKLSRNARRIIARWDNERMVKGFREAIEYAIQNR